MGPPAIPGGRPAPPNPFYANSGGGGGGASASSGYGRPTSSMPAEPVQYGSLKDLQKNQKQSSKTFSYKPSAERAGYHAPPPEPPVEAAQRRMPPAPSNHGQPLPPPPRRTVPNEPSPYEHAGGGTSTFSNATSRLPPSAQGYANTAGSYASSAAERVKDGFGSIATVERRDQIAGGVVKGAAGAAKLLGKGAWQLGKFASGNR